MATSNGRDRVVDSAWKIHDEAVELMDQIKKTTGATYTDGYHKRVSGYVSAMNVARSTLQTVVVREQLILRSAQTEDDLKLLTK